MRGGSDDNEAGKQVRAHPLRCSIVDALTDSTVVTARQVADDNGVDLATASYHLFVLEDAGMVEVAETQHDGRQVVRIFRATPSDAASP